MGVLRISDRMRRIRRTRAFIDANRPERAGLKDTYELQPNPFEQREEGDNQPAAIVTVGEQIFEAARLAFRQPIEKLLHADLPRGVPPPQPHPRPHLQALAALLASG